MHSFHLAFVIRPHLASADIVSHSLPLSLSQSSSLEFAHHDAGSYYGRVRPYYPPI